jgi:SAM-dependent methyltransferase
MERGREIAPVIHAALPDGPALEVGVGTGLVAAALGELGRTVVGIDLSVPMLTRAAARLPGRVAAGDAHRLPVGTGAVAGAYLVHVLHLVGDVPATLGELHRVLRDGGSLATTVRSPDPPRQSDVADVLGELLAAFPRATDRADDADLVEDAARAAGFEAVGRFEVRRTGYQTTPREVADRVVERSWSWMWDIPPDVWRPVADPIVARLRALPDQDRPRVSGEIDPVLTFRRV